MLFFSNVFCIRLIHSSDTHGWLFGNPHVELVDAKFGDILSFIAASKKDRPTLALDSGDFIQGCGLSDATEIQGEYVLDAWRQAFQSLDFYDFVGLGNHDIMLQDATKILKQNLLNDNVRSHTLTLNILENNGTIGNKFQLHTVDGVRYLLFGIMYQMSAAADLYISDYLNELRSQQFSSYIHNADAVIALIHIGWVQHPESYHQIYEVIRSQTDKPIIIMGGHEHQAHYEYGVAPNASFVHPFPYLLENGKDMNAVFVESLNYFQELTILDFQVRNGRLAEVSYKQLPCNKAAFMAEYSLAELSHPLATQIQDQIDRMVNELGIMEQIGVSPQQYVYLDPDLQNKDSTWNLWMYEMVPKILYARNESGKLKHTPVHILGTSFFNSGIYAGPVFVNDLYVTVPYTDEFFYDYPVVKGSDLKLTFCKMIGGCEKKHVGSPPGFPKYFISIQPEDLKDDAFYSVVLSDYDSVRFEQKAASVGVTLKRDDGLYTGLSPFDVYSEFVRTEWSQ